MSSATKWDYFVLALSKQKKQGLVGLATGEYVWVWSDTNSEKDTSSITEKLKHYGQEGWELVSAYIYDYGIETYKDSVRTGQEQLDYKYPYPVVSRYIYIFKRPK